MENNLPFPLTDTQIAKLRAPIFRAFEVARKHLDKMHADSWRWIDDQILVGNKVDLSKFSPEVERRMRVFAPAYTALVKLNNDLNGFLGVIQKTDDDYQQMWKRISDEYDDIMDGFRIFATRFPGE